MQRTIAYRLVNGTLVVYDVRHQAHAYDRESAVFRCAISRMFRVMARQP